MTIKNLTEPSRTENFQDGDFLEYSYPDGRIIRKHFYAPKPPTEEEIAQQERNWRDGELAVTDYIVPLIDHPKHSEYMTYRQELRDYPSQPDFPNGQRPLKP